MIKVLSIFGTRPEAIKMAPVIHELEKYPDQIQSVVCVTAQHREMLDQVLDLFKIIPDIDLDLMRAGQSLCELTARVFTALDPILKREAPDWVLVQGDTTTVMAASLVAFYHRVKVGHVEAGLRTFDKWQPFPEEINRKVAGVIADLHFAPTKTSKENLLREGVDSKRVFVTGNPVIDALQLAAEMPYDLDSEPLLNIPWKKRILLVTAHRRENLGEPLENICRALLELIQKYKDIHVVYPVHHNPQVRDPVYRLLGDQQGITLLPPLEYLTLVQLMKRSYLVLTDSGGIQEEAPGLGIPVLVLREVTERPEAVEAGTVRLVGTDQLQIIKETEKLLTKDALYRKMSRSINPYGDGNASERIVNNLLEY